MRGFAERLLATLRSKRRLERLNHILIPEKKDERDRLRRRFRWRLMTPLFAVFGALSPDGRALLLLSIFVGLAGIDVDRSQVNLFFGAISGLLLGSLLLRPFFALRGLSASVEAPRRVSVGEPQRFLVRLANQGSSPLVGLRLEGPFLPWDGRWTQSRGGVGELKPDGRATLVAEARFRARGEHHLDNFSLAALLPLGLSVGPATAATTPRFLVVPKLAKVVCGPDFFVEQRARHAKVSARSLGESELVGVRPYRVGDPLKHLHARTWARTGVPHVRVHSTERSDLVGLVVVTDGLDSTDEVKEAAVSVIAGAASQLLAAGFGVDFLQLDQQRFRVEPRTGRGALNQVLDRLATHSFSDDEIDVAPGLLAGASRLGWVLMVVCHARQLSVVDSLRQRGVSARALLVTDERTPRTGAVPSGTTTVSWQHVEQGLEVPL